MQRLLLSLLILCSLPAAAQLPCSQVYGTVDVAASYQSGDNSLVNFKNSELTPLVVGCAGTDFDKVGSLYLLLTIDSTGAVRGVDFAQGRLSEACKAKVRARILAMEGWKPARLAGGPVCSRFRWALGNLGSAVQGSGSLRGADTLPHMRMAPVEKPKPIDSNISIGAFDPSPFAVRLEPAEKKKRVTKAVKQTFGESSGLFLKDPCLTLDSATGMERKLKEKAPGCRLNDFYFLDIDKDGDLDILYASVTDQYLGWGSNRIFLFRNDGTAYKMASLPGYLYGADFSQWEKGFILLRTVQRPDGPAAPYRFFEHRLFTSTWTMPQTTTFNRRPGLVQERR